MSKLYDAVEEDRQKDLAIQLSCGLEEVNFLPGTIGYHELLHTAHITNMLFTNEILDHPATSFNSDVYHAASELSVKLSDFYQLLGAKLT